MDDNPKSLPAHLCRLYSWRLAIVLILLWSALASSRAYANQPYRIAAGDQIELVILSAPKLERTLTVDQNGEATFPMLGSVRVAGLTVSELRKTIYADLASHMLNKSTTNSASASTVIRSDQVYIRLAKKRPIYISGRVARPGEYDYRVFMTVREAVALAGGYRVLLPQGQNLGPVVSDWKSDFGVQWLGYAKLLADYWRIQSTLGLTKDTVDEATAHFPKDTPVDQMVVERVFGIAWQRLRQDKEAHEQELTFLRSAILKLDQQIEVVKKQEKDQARSLNLDNAELNKLKKLYARGALNNNRFAQVRRSVLVSSSQLQQTRSRLIEIRNRRSTTAQQLKRAPQERKSQMYKELDDLLPKISATQIKLAGIASKLALAGTSVGNPNARAQPKFKVTVHRRDKDGLRELDADLGFQLNPGDHVEIEEIQRKLSLGSSGSN